MRHDVIQRWQPKTVINNFGSHAKAHNGYKPTERVSAFLRNKAKQMGVLVKSLSWLSVWLWQVSVLSWVRGQKKASQRQNRKYSWIWLEGSGADASISRRTSPYLKSFLTWRCYRSVSSRIRKNKTLQGKIVIWIKMVLLKSFDLCHYCDNN